MRYLLTEVGSNIPIAENLKDCLVLIRSDYFRYNNKTSNIIKILLFCLKDTGFAYLFWYRLCTLNGFIGFTARLLRRHLSRKYSIQIPKEVKAGYGLYLGHGFSIVISPSTIIGNNCNLSQFCNIGTNKGKAATIGDNVYIGPMTCIVEDVKIESNSTIGAGAVVTRNISQNATAVGIPAKEIHFNNPAQFIKNKYTKNK